MNELYIVYSVGELKINTCRCPTLRLPLLWNRRLFTFK